MGKHSRQEACSVCHGHGTTDVSHDGTTDRVPCPACDGTGTQP